MKRIEVKLSLPVVAPLLDVIKAAADTLASEMASSLSLQDIDPDVRDDWKSELVEGQNEEIRILLALFDEEFYRNGVIGIDEDNADSLVRACSAVRLRLRERFMPGLPDEVLENGDVEMDVLEDPVRKAFMCYLFLATVQELIIQHLDSSILDS
ncbi:MAG TPA: hypothetical protein VGD88_04340 [Opitutaceae bacterium]